MAGSPESCEEADDRWRSIFDAIGDGHKGAATSELLHNGVKGTSDFVSTVGSTFVSGAVDCCCTSVTNGVESEVLGLTGLSCSGAVVLDDKCSDGSVDEVDGGKRGLRSCLFRLIRRLLSAFTIQYESGWVSRDSMYPGFHSLHPSSVNHMFWFRWYSSLTVLGGRRWAALFQPIYSFVHL